MTRSPSLTYALRARMIMPAVTLAVIAVSLTVTYLAGVTGLLVALFVGLVTLIRCDPSHLGSKS